MSSDFSGAHVLDEHGEAIGTVKDVVFDPESATPAWMVVKTGLLRGTHYVPTVGSYRSVDDDVVVPFGAALVQSAPKARGDHIVTPELEEELTAHYELAGL